MTTPLVTVICLCYNHARFVKEAIESVFAQTYPNVEIIILDDASTDDSVEVIQETIADRKDVLFLRSSENTGNCRAFNRAFARANGKYIVDFSTDDVMVPERIEMQIGYFETLDARYGVVFSDALYIDENGNHLRKHFSWLRRKGLLKDIPTGDVYKEILQHYFVSSPTMLVKREVFESLGGYDERLAYEDFDFWVRSSRDYWYACIDKPLTHVRIIQDSLSKRLYKTGDHQLYSTYLICRKVVDLNRDELEKDALIQRIRYELRHAVLTENRVEATLFYGLLREISNADAGSRFFILLNTMRLPLARLRKWYLKIRYT